MAKKAHLGWDFALSVYDSPVDTDEIAEDHESYSDEVMVISAVKDKHGKLSYGYFPVDSEGAARMDAEFIHRYWVAMAAFLAQKQDLDIEMRRRCMDIVKEYGHIIDKTTFDFGELS